MLSYKPVVSYSLIAMSKSSAMLHGSQGTGCSLVIWCLATTPMLVSLKVVHDDAKKCCFSFGTIPFLHVCIQILRKQLYSTWSDLPNSILNVHVSYPGILLGLIIVICTVHEPVLK